MLNITNYVRAKNLDEAYELCQKKNSKILGGMLWLKMQNRTLTTAIDLCDLGLDTIEETDEHYVIGAMVSLRTLETHAGLNALTQGAMADSVKHIVGVQFRNVATVGGSLFGRFGFSDVLTLFQVLDAQIELHHHGLMSVAEFANMSRTVKDVLVRVLVPKTPKKVVYLSERTVATDFPTMTCAISEINGAYTCAIGARPFEAVALSDETGILANGITAETAAAFGDYIAQQAHIGGNLYYGKDYRQRVCAVLVRRGLLKLQEV